MLADKCNQIIAEYLAVQEKLYDSEITSNIKELTKVNRQLNRDKKLYDLSVKYISAFNENNEAKQILESETDPDMIELAKAQLTESAHKLSSLEEELTEEMLPKDPNDDKDCFVEIRPAAGGDEAGLFGAALFKCYCLYADQMGWKYEIMDQQLSDIGGVKLIIMKIS